ncbi:glycoside hydrolase family 2 protein [Crenothrix polyspora]|uniref:Glycoside hydrolase family 2, sugar binding n=1 Tax=Crenothrix polyspora TaxID=360316 RepID=A0A1R4H0J7_9GAMM|nr:sugar-binding domain-containing protein [Crenothrix polyspora]SJM89746.1 Glycoside hydrolase family 2, sugar binding [Crenothrix polyspora]
MNSFDSSIFKVYRYGLLLTFIVTAPLICVAETVKTPSIQDNISSARIVIPLSGTWQFKTGDLKSSVADTSKNNVGHWENINVPANWYLEGHDINGIAWYSKNFTLPSQYANKHISLKFSGVDYTTEVWLNGKYIGFHEGYFQSFNFDITKAVIFGKENQLMVKVNSPLEKMGEDWSLHKKYIKGIFGHHDTRPGGAWSVRAQEKNTGGIWAPVELEIHEVAVIEQVKVTPQLNLDKHSANADVQLHIGLQQATAMPVKIQLTLKPYNFAATQSISKEIFQELKSGFNGLHIPIAIKKPALWWSWDQGKPNLYTLDIKVFAKNKVIDTKTVTFGFRDVRYDKAHNEWRINGRRMFLRGTNYIATQWLSEMTNERFAQDIALMKTANINIVRVHAHVTAEDYYRLCDESGLLNWQDFPLQWGYTDDDAFHKNAIRQARDMVNSLFNHPSIIAWSLINEPAWEAEWMQYKYKKYNKLQNKALTTKLYQAISPLDPTRYVHPFSASAEHPWLGWYSGDWHDYTQPSKVSLVAEYGAQALPHLFNLRKIISAKDIWPTTDKQWAVWDYHNFQKKNVFKVANISMGNTSTEFIKNTQTYQSKLIKLAAESLRRQRYQPVSGIFQFMFVEDWPSMNWGVIDYWRSPKSGYYALKQAYQPILPSIEWKQENYKYGETVSLKLWAINDLPQSYQNAQVTYSLRNGEKLLEHHTLTIDLNADSGREIKIINWNHLAAGHYQFFYTLSDNQGNTLGFNSHEFDISEPLKTTVSKLTADKFK